MPPPTLVPVSPSGERHNASKRLSSSVPSSPTSKNPALRSSKGSFFTPAGATSPRRAPSCASCSCSGSDSHKGGLPTTQYSPTQKAGKGAQHSLMAYASGLFSRPLLLVFILFLSNYLGYMGYPFLWTAQDRAAVVAIITKPLRSVGSSPGDHGADRQLGAGQPAFDLDGQGSASLLAASGIEDPTATATTTANPLGIPADVSRSASLDGPQEAGMSEEALLRSDSQEEVTPASVLQNDNDVPQGQQAEAESAGQQYRLGVSNGADGEAARMSPYVHPWTISVAQHPSCRKIYPRHLVKSSQGPIAFVGDLLRKRQRLLLTIPRHGLGNSLRGYVSSFVYAALSGRRLVRFHGAEHAKVFDTLCHSFQCGFEAIEGDEDAGGSMGLYKQLERLNPVDLNSKFKVSASVLTSLRSTWSLFVTKSPHFFDGFWHNFPLVRQCIYDAFGCSSAWCVRSRAMQALVGPPTALLEDVISKVLRKHVGAGKADVAGERDPNAMFDVALHLRTRPAAIESKNPGSEDKGQALMKIGCGAPDDRSDQASQYLKGCLWDCVGGILKRLQAQRHALGRPMDILLATDNEELRPAFVEKLAKFGTVYYSSGVIVHSSKSASLEAERLPTMAEFHLMSRAHTILEAGSYVSTFAYFSGLLGNGTLAGIDWKTDGSCGLKYVHRGELQASR